MSCQIQPRPHLSQKGVTSSQEDSLVMEEVQAMLKKGPVVEVPGQERARASIPAYFWFPRRAGHETSYQFQGPEQVHSIHAFQNGRDAHPEGRPEGERLDGEGGSEGCILHDPNLGNRQRCSTSPLRAACSSSPVYHLAYHGLHGSYHTGDGRLEASGGGAFSGPDIPTGIPELHSSPREDSESTHTENKIPGNEHSFKNHEASIPTSKDKESLGRSSRPLEESSSSSHSKRSITPSRENEFSRTGTPTGSTVLQDNTKGLSPSRGTGRAIIRNPMLAVRPSQGGTLLVGRTHAGVEQKKPDPQGARHIDRIGCLTDGLGSIVPRDSYWGSMVE